MHAKSELQEKFLKWVSQTIKPEQKPEAFAAQCLKNAGIFGIMAWIFAALFLKDALTGFFWGFGLTCVGFGVLLWQPVSRRKQNALKAEADLPFVLMTISVELSLNISFERVLFSAGQTGFGNASRLFAIAYREIHEKGASVHEAIHALARQLVSADAKRAVLQVLVAYEQGSGKRRAEIVRRSAEALLAKQRIASKAFSNQVALYSLVFIVVSAVVPAIFQVMVVAGSGFLDLSLTPLQVLLLVAVGFPLLNISVLYAMRRQTPVFLRT